MLVCVCGVGWGGGGGGGGGAGNIVVKVILPERVSLSLRRNRWIPITDK